MQSDLRKAMWKVLTEPMVLGPIYLVFVTLRALTGSESDLELGSHGAAIMGLVNGRYGQEVRHAAIAVLVFAAAVGLALGFVATVLLAIRRYVRKGTVASGPLLRAVQSLLAVLVLHLFTLAWGIVRTPQLYAASLYAVGGARRTIEVILTDLVGTAGLGLLSALTLLVFLLGSPSEWQASLTRLAVGIRSIAKSPKVLISSAMALLCLAAYFGARDVGVVNAQGADQKPNIVLIAADSLRYDRITPRVAPNLSQLKENGVSFDHAYVSLPRTFPSWVSLLTGRFPHHHGIRSMFPRTEDRAKDFDAVPANLAKEGYYPVVVSDYAGDIFGRINLGFENVDTPSFDFRELVRERVLEQAIPLMPFLHTRLGRWIFPTMRELSHAADPAMLVREVESAIAGAPKKPLFLSVFFSTAHFPYAAPYPYYFEFAPTSYRGRFKYHRPVGLAGDGALSEEDVTQTRNLYDGSVAAIDHAVGDLLTDLKKLPGPTWVVLLADHGETLYDFGHGQGHGDHLFGDEGTHIPLVFAKLGGGPHAHVEGVVRDVDLAPTLYDLAHAKSVTPFDGESLLPAIEGKPLTPRLAFAETGLWFTEDVPSIPAGLRFPYPSIERMTEIDVTHGDEVVLQKKMKATTIFAKHRMVRDDKYKLIYIPLRSGRLLALYDLMRDPGETKDVGREHPEEVARLMARLQSWALDDKHLTLEDGLLVPKGWSADDAPNGSIRIEGSETP